MKGSGRDACVRWLVFLGILLVPVTPLVWTALTRTQGVEEMFAPGPLARGHAHLECRDCHAEPWRGGRKAVGQASGAAAMDRACAACHGGLVPVQLSAAAAFPRLPLVQPHNQQQPHGNLEHCADCHREHQGTPALTRTSDADCGRCHGNLQPEGGATRFARHITDLETDHPPFGHWRGLPTADPGRLHFNHRVHLALKAEGLPTHKETLVRLQAEGCAFCHRPEPGGRGMAPVRYEAHCASCHPLTVKLRGSGWTGEAATAARAFAHEAAPHATPTAVRDALRRRLSHLALQHPELLELEVKTPPRLLPGKPPPPAPPREPRAWVGYQMEAAERLLFVGANGCRRCHQETAKTANGLPDLPATQVPGRWLPHGQFHHARHSMLACTDCHRATVSLRAADVLLPTLADCVRCHTRQPKPGAAPADCLQCHRYHAAADVMPATR